MSTPRITRGFYSRIPRWSTNYPEPFNWSLVSAADCVPLAFTLVLVDPFSWAFFPAVCLSVLWFCLRFGYRLRRRRRWCAEHRHDPYRPVPEVAEYRCWTCDRRLDSEDAVQAVEAAAERIPQARWSDRR